MRPVFIIISSLFFLTSCALQPITEPRRPNPAEEPTIIPTAISIEKPTYIVEQGSVTSELFKSGRVTPVNQNRLSFPLNGTIKTLFVEKGETVTAGDVVAVLDTTPLEQAQQAAESDLNLAREQLQIFQENKAGNPRQAEIGVELAQLQLDYAVAEGGDTPTAQQTLNIEVLTRELELAQLNLDVVNRTDNPSLANDVAQGERQLERIKSQIAQSTLVAPASGTVIVANIRAGDTIGAEETVLVIADLNQVDRGGVEDAGNLDKAVGVGGGFDHVFGAA